MEAIELRSCVSPSPQDGVSTYSCLCKTGLVSHLGCCLHLAATAAHILAFFWGALQDWLLSLVPHLVHAASNILADVTATGCHPRDLLPSMLAGQCGGCSAAAVFRWGHAKVAVTPTALLQSWCLPTHLAQPQPLVSECWGAIKLLACVVQLLVCLLQQGWPAPVSCGCLRQCMLCSAEHALRQ